MMRRTVCQYGQMRDTQLKYAETAANTIEVCKVHAGALQISCLTIESQLADSILAAGCRYCI